MVIRPGRALPVWLTDRLRQQVGFGAFEVAAMTPEEAMRRLEAHWSHPQ